MSSRDHWARIGIWASLKSSVVMSSVWAACLRDMGMSPSICDVALAGSCLGKPREREVEKGLEKGRSIREKTTGPKRQHSVQENDGGTVSTAFAQLSLCHASHTPLFSVFCSPSKPTSKTSQISFLPQMTLTTSSG